MSITSKRKAQNLVREGKIQNAIEVLREGFTEGEPDPYDHVYLGDLLMRVGETEDSLTAYQTAIRSYEDVGLYRNAVAIGKKMLRIDSRRPEIHRCLASLYDREGLQGEAIPHYLVYLDSFAGDSVPPTEFLETLDHAASITGSKVEVALRLSEHFLRIRRNDRAAALLEEVAANADVAGSAEMAQELRQRAAEARGAADGGASTAEGADGPPPLPVAESVGGVDVSGAHEPGGGDSADPDFPPPPPPIEQGEPISFDSSAIEAALSDDSITSGLDPEPIPEVLDLDEPDPAPLGGVRDVGGAAGKPDAEADSAEFDLGDLRDAPDTSDSSDDEDGFVVEHFTGSSTTAAELSSDDSDGLEMDGFELASQAGPAEELDFGDVDLSSGIGSSGDREKGALDSDLEGPVDGEVEEAPSAPAKARSRAPKTTMMEFDASVLESVAGASEFEGDEPGEDHVYEIELDEDDAAGFELTPVSDEEPTSKGAPDPQDDGSEPALELPDAEASAKDEESSAHESSAPKSAVPESAAREPSDSKSAASDASKAVEPKSKVSVDAGEEASSPVSGPSVPKDVVADLHGKGTSDRDTGAAESMGREVTIDEANDAFLAGRWSEARQLYEHILEDDPNNRRILARLVETIRYLQDHHGEVHYLVQLGEVWIQEDELEEALECFLKVVRLDPENSTAKRRLSRFREMGVRGAEVIEESDSNSVHGVLETGRTEVQIRGEEESFRSEDWVELEGLLEEFKDGLKNQMEDGDYQGHYDLAVSYHGMGLLEEALEAADRALASDGVPLAVERQARELKGSCLTELHRYREAVHEYREAVEKAGDDRQSRRTALYHLARSLEALEEWQEAVDTFVQLKLEAPGFLDVEDRIRGCEERRGGSSSRPPSEAA